MAPDPQDSAARVFAPSPPAQSAPWSWQPERRDGIGLLRATPLRHRFPVTEATEKRCPPSIPSGEGCVGEGPAPSLAEETSFLRNGGCSHTVINGEGEYERPFLNPCRCGWAVAEVTDGRTGSGRQVALRDNGMRWKGEEDPESPRREGYIGVSGSNSPRIRWSGVARLIL